MFVTLFTRACELTTPWVSHSNPVRIFTTFKIFRLQLCPGSGQTLPPPWVQFRLAAPSSLPRSSSTYLTAHLQYTIIFITHISFWTFQGQLIKLNFPRQGLKRWINQRFETHSCSRLQGTDKRLQYPAGRKLGNFIIFSVVFHQNTNLLNRPKHLFNLYIPAQVNTILLSSLRKTAGLKREHRNSIET